VQATLRAVTQPLVAWFLFVATFLVWHDPSLAKFMLGEAGAQLTWHYAAPWLLLVASLLFWWPVIDSGPRFQRAFPAWLLIAYLVSVEVFNMVAGISIAFSMEPLYAHYVAVRAQLPADALPWGPVTDQIAGGAIVWVFGSMVYISSIVFVLFGLFRKEADSTTPLRLPDWDANAKFIAPGLEHRVAQNELRKADLSHH
jgi:cytochrome c oxidase assembly factor CtaG